MSPTLRAATTRLALLPPGRAARVAAGLLAQRTLTAMHITQIRTAAMLIAAGLAVTAGAIAAAAPRTATTAPVGEPPPVATARQQPADPTKAADPAGLVTKEWDLADFTAVEIRSAFQAEVRLGDKFAVTTTVEPPVADLVEVRRERQTLRVGLAPTSGTIRVERPFRVRITLPRLEGIDLTGAARLTLLGEPSLDRLRVRLLGAARVDGTVRAKHLDLEAHGASQVTLRGGADEAEVAAEGASRLELADLALGATRARLSGQSKANLMVRSPSAVPVDLAGGAQLAGSVEAPALDVRASGSSRVEVGGKVDRLTLVGSSSSRAELGKLAVVAANVDLSSSSRAAVLASGTLRYHLSSSSRLESLGDPENYGGEVSSGAKFSRVP